MASVDLAPARVTALDVMGVDIEIRSGGADGDLLKAAVDDAWQDCRAGSGRVTANPVVIECLVEPDPATAAGARRRGAVVEASLTMLLDRLSPVVTTAAIQRRQGDLLMLHACALAHPGTGATVAFVAPSGTGKTTLVRQLCDTWSYVTDETVGVTAVGQVIPYPKPLSILDAEESTHKRQVPGSRLGLLPVPSSGLQLAGIVVMDRDPRLSAPQVEEVGILEALAMLAPSVSLFGALPHPLGFMAGVLERAGGLVHVRYGEASTLRTLVESLLVHP